MELFNNPSKKMRLDENADDLWARDDIITAEQFDDLEFQATQSLQVSNIAHHHTLANTSRNEAKATENFFEEESVKQQQYELEGKVKLLSDTLHNTSKELREERINRNRLVAEKVKEHEEKEVLLRKEIQRMQSNLQFKDQEMKTVYEKVHFLEKQVQENREASQSSAHPRSPNKNFKRFHEVPESNAAKKRRGHHRKRNFSLDVSSKGENNGNFTISLLCNRLTTHNLTMQPSTEELCMSAMPIVGPNPEQQIEELLDYYHHTLRNYLIHLRNVDRVILTQSPGSPKNRLSDSSIVIPCLKDLSVILSSSRFRCYVDSLNYHQEIEVESVDLPPLQAMEVDNHESGSNKSTEQQDLQGLNLSVIEFNDMHSETPVQRLLSFVKILFRLTNHDAYPNGHQRNKEIDWSISSLLSWSSSAPDFMVQFAGKLPFRLLLDSRLSAESTFSAIQILTKLSAHRKFASALVHKSGSCIICCFQRLCFEKLSCAQSEFIRFLLMIEDFLSVLFTCHNVNDLKLEESPCLPQIICVIIKSIFTGFQFVKKGLPTDILCLQKGIALVHLLSQSIPNFKEKRADAEDFYIFLISGLVLLSKEMPVLKENSDLLHDLWDFQEDTSIFDQTPDDFSA